MKTKSSFVALLLPVALAGWPTAPSQAVDLLARYPTRLTAGDATPENARPWEFNDSDIFRVSRFSFEVGKSLQVETGPADIGIGHCEDGAVWAVVLPREGGKLASSAAQGDEMVSQIWLRFHPAELNRVFPPETVFEDGAKTQAGAIRAVAAAKFTASWHAGQSAMIPERKDLTVDMDTRGGSRRFFVVDNQAQTAEYVAAFDRQGGQRSRPISLAAAPPVVIKTSPVAGATDVDPGLTELTVTYSKLMLDGNWSWSTWGEENFPETTGKPQYLADGRTCVLHVKLKPGKFYATWLNSDKFHGFQDASGSPAVPYLLTFHTAEQAK